MNSKARTTSLIPGALAFLALVLWVLFCLTKLWPHGDDAYIFYSYARNIALGAGYVFQPGEYINAATSTLYTLILAAGLFTLKGFAAPENALPIISQILTTVSLAVVCLFGTLSIGRERGWVAGTLFPVLFLSSRILEWGVGMETFLLLAILTVTLWLYLRRSFLLCGTAAALAVLARPDALLLVGLIFADYAVFEKRPLPFKFFMPFILLVGGWAVFSTLYFGSPLPSTLAAKQAQASGRWSETFVFLDRLPSRLENLYGAATLPLALFGLIVSLLNLGKLRNEPAARIIMLWGILLILSYGFVIRPTPHPWYYVPFSLWIAWIIAVAVSRIELHVPRRIYALLVLGVVISAAFIPVGRLFDTETLLKQTAATLTRPASEGKYFSYTAAARWLNDHAPQGASLATAEVGMLRFFYEKGPIIDALGLVTPGAEDALRKGNFSWHLERFSPDYVITRTPPRVRIEAFVNTPSFRQDYEAVFTLRNQGMFPITLFARREIQGAG